MIVLLFFTYIKLPKYYVFTIFIVRNAYYPVEHPDKHVANSLLLLVML